MKKKSFYQQMFDQLEHLLCTLEIETLPKREADAQIIHDTRKNLRRTIQWMKERIEGFEDRDHAAMMRGLENINLKQKNKELKHLLEAYEKMPLCLEGIAYKFTFTQNTN